MGKEHQKGEKTIAAPRSKHRQTREKKAEGVGRTMVWNVSALDVNDFSRVSLVTIEGPDKENSLDSHRTEGGVKASREKPGKGRSSSRREVKVERKIRPRSRKYNRPRRGGTEGKQRP